MSSLAIIVLGVIQGFTEFLPVSSSAHLIVFSWALGGKPIPLSLNVAFHFGTTLAVLIHFRQDWWRLAFGSFSFLRGNRDVESTGAASLLLKLIIGSIPAGIIGLLFKDEIERWLHHPLAIVIPLIIVGFGLWLVDRHCRSGRDIDALSKPEALGIGFAQMLALIPGVSRSGSTIMMARWLNLGRLEAARFSFLLGTPAMLGATALHIPALLNGEDIWTTLTAVISAFLSGMLAISLFLKFISRFGFLSFAIYRLVLAIAIVAAYT